MKKISIIIPTYKPGSYLEETLRSVFDQQYPIDSFEILIILNGPFKPYLSFIETYVQQHGSKYDVKIILSKIKGVSHARNVGVENSTYDYFVFLDDDDILGPDFLQKTESLASPNTVVVSHVLNFKSNISEKLENYINISAKKISNNKKVNLNEIRSLLSVVWGKLIPKNVVNQVMFNPDFTIGEDSLFMFQISKNIKDIKLVDTTYYHRIREQSAIQIKKPITFEIKNTAKLCWAYFKVFSGDPLNYDGLLFITRMAAAMKRFTLTISRVHF